MNDTKKILIIEDHKDMLRILTRNLQDNQFEVLGAENAETGIQMLAEFNPDLILMDLMLPGMSGLEAIAIIKEKISDQHHIPIIIITAKGESDDIVLGLNTGADDYIVKPFNFDELIARVKTALRLKALNEKLFEQTAQLEQANRQIYDLNQSLVEKNRELRRNVFNLHTIFEISIELNSILEIDRLVNSTLLTMVGQFSCKNAMFIYNHDMDHSHLRVKNSKGFNEEEVQNLAFEKEDPLFKYILRHPYPLDISVLKARVNGSNAIDIFENLDVQIISPLILQSKVQGLIVLGPRVRTQAYQRQEIENISILTNIVTISMQNATLYQQVEQLSYTDGMTDLHNFRYFKLRLKEEVGRHKRTNTGLSLLILDVDNFKNYNDTMGHPAGDKVLKKLGAILTASVRENDIVARYGGEEFAVILPAIEHEGAGILAERIREKIETTPFDNENVQPLGKITVSIGAASLPVDANNTKDLIRFADNALYEAKRSGRNKVHIFNKKTLKMQ
ncbi:MAG: diguanylate cyclase [Calditrichaceae bacterium]|nr:diguanylate cyclase [Calditrichaceae bacterium]RQV96106.1 MAG: diguanylate cyclase [Calditrichota bacterium]